MLVCSSSWNNVTVQHTTIWSVMSHISTPLDTTFVVCLLWVTVHFKGSCYTYAGAFIMASCWFSLRLAWVIFDQGNNNIPLLHCVPTIHLVVGCARWESLPNPCLWHPGCPDTHYIAWEWRSLPVVPCKVKRRRDMGYFRPFSWHRHTDVNKEPTKYSDNVLNILGRVAIRPDNRKVR